MDAMEIDDNINDLTKNGIVSQADFQKKKQPCRSAAVCLGLLCAVLLAGNIAQFVQRLQADHTTLQATKDQLQTNCTSSRMNKDQLQASYTTLTEERDQLKKSNDDMQKSLQELQADHMTLQGTKDQLQTNCTSSRMNKDQLQASYTILTEERDQLKKSNDDMQKSLQELQADHMTLQATKDQLQTNYQTLQREKEEFQVLSVTLRANNDRLQKSCNTSSTSQPCERGWRKFENSCYYISNVTSMWRSSRADCISKRADLVIINSVEEQAFVNGLMRSGQYAWIGMTDSEEEGTWKWVDGTPVTTTFWQSGQPNGKNKNQDCGETLKRVRGVGEWNDESCSASQIYICEQ